MYRQIMPSARIFYVQACQLSICQTKDCLLIKHGSSVFQVNYQLWFYFLSVFLLLFMGDSLSLLSACNFFFCFFSLPSKKRNALLLVLFLCKQEKYRTIKMLNINLPYNKSSASFIHIYYKMDICCLKWWKDFVIYISAWLTHLKSVY